MSRQPTPDRYDSQTFGSGLQLRVRAGSPRPELEVEQEAALLGTTPLFVAIKENRLKAEAIIEKNTKPTEDVDKIWPTPELFGIEVPGHLKVTRSTSEEKTPVSLKVALDNIKGDAKGLITGVEVDLRTMDPRVYYKAAVRRHGHAFADRIRVTAYDDKRLKVAVRFDEVMEPDRLFTTKPRDRRWLIDLYGPRGEVVKTVEQLENK